MASPALASAQRWQRTAAERVTALPRWVQVSLPLAGYLLFALVWLARGVALHPRSHVFGDAGPDKTIYMWSFKWWPWATVHGHDPFDATWVWAPHGIDLAWVTAMPGASYVLTPVTETLGPVFAYNLAAVATLALSAWTAYLLARKLTATDAPALVAGFLYGFSSYMVGQSTGHLNLTLVFLIPVAGLLALAFLRDEVGRWKYAVLLGVVLTFQFLFSNEIFVTLTVVAIVVWIVARWQLPELRERLGELALQTLLAYVIAGVLLTPYLAHAFGGGSAPPRRGHARAAADVLNYVVPTRRTWIRPPHSENIRELFTSHGAEQGAYLGLPLIAILALAAFGGRRRRALTVALVSGVVVALFSLGPVVRIRGRPVGDGIWKVIDNAPFVRYALPIRLTMYVALFAALVCALWLAQPGRARWRWLLAGLAVVALLPNPSQRLWNAAVPRSSFFDSGAYEQYLRAGQTALVIPYGPAGWSMLWQAKSDFRFRMIGGHVGHHIIKPECRWYWDYRALAGVDPPDGAAGFRRFLLAHDVAAVIEGPGTKTKIHELLDAALPDVDAVSVDDALVRPLRASLPAALPAGGPQLAPSKPRKKPRRLPPECAGASR